jgi:hypothetical protein
MSELCSLTPILPLLGRDFLVRMRLFTLSPSTLLLLGAMQQEKR